MFIETFGSVHGKKSKTWELANVVITRFMLHLNPLSPNSDQHQFSPKKNP